MKILHEHGNRGFGTRTYTFREIRLASAMTCLLLVIGTVNRN